jgi:alkylation response protein AidB-like acyl-CoA dehydrogenase
LTAHSPTVEDWITFRGHQFDAGLAWVHFPLGQGGLGVGVEHQPTVERRLRLSGISEPDAAAFFLALAGPTLVMHATDEQKRRFLRPMFTGEEKWCQLFSEPGAGSDFAGLATSARRDGDEWIVNGQKVWNTMAHRAQWGMLVARTDPNVPKHKGLTYFVLDMMTPGVEIRPLRQITGEAEFNEVFLSDVRVPDDFRIGDVGNGWGVALTTLMNERMTFGGGGEIPRRGAGPIEAAVTVWADLPDYGRNAARRDQLVRLWIRAECVRLTNIRMSARTGTEGPGPERSIAKLSTAELNQDIFEFAIDALGADALVDYDYTFVHCDTMSTDGSQRGVRHAFMRVRANSIEGGTSEIMRNILAEQVLGLPGEPRVDKDVSWIKVPRN